MTNLLGIRVVRAVRIQIELGVFGRNSRNKKIRIFTSVTDGSV